VVIIALISTCGFYIQTEREKERNYEEWRDAERVEDREKAIYILI
jgi:hypothetical protein